MRGFSWWLARFCKPPVSLNMDLMVTAGGFVAPKTKESHKKDPNRVESECIMERKEGGVAAAKSKSVALYTPRWLGQKECLN